MKSHYLGRLFLLGLWLAFGSVANAKNPDNINKSDKGNNGEVMLQGLVTGSGSGLTDYKVSLLASFIVPAGKTEVVGSARTDSYGEFKIKYQIPMGLPSDKAPIMYVIAEKGASMLVTVAGQGPVTGPIVVNEMTTVATSYAFAQFIEHRTIQGNKWGMLNA